MHDKHKNDLTRYRNESDAMQALLYYCTLMESPDLELDAKQTKKISAKVCCVKTSPPQSQDGDFATQT